MMTTTAAPQRPAPSTPDASLRGAQLPVWLPTIVLIASAIIGAAISISADWGIVRGVLLAWAVSLSLPLISRIIEGSRKAVDRLVTHLVYSAFALAILPLGSIIYTVVSRGVPAINAEFLTYSMRNVVGDGGGIYHALIGTLLITAAATLISVPIGLFTAIYIVEYGDGNRISGAIRFLVDVMTGIPSIVAGLFAYALLVLFFGPGVRLGIGGAIALSVLMIPIVVRSAEEMLKLVPNELREASYALGVPKWRTIAKVVMPTAMAGIVTGVTLAIARVIGETAPLLIVVGAADSVNFNLFSGRMATLPVFSYFSLQYPGVPREFGIERAWGAALVLLVIVMFLNLLARLVSYLFSPKGEK